MADDALPEVIEGPEAVGSWREVEGPDPWLRRSFARAREPEASAFLRGLADGLSPTGAAKRAGIARQQASAWRNADPEFEAAWREAYAAGTELFEDEGRRRALLGVLEPIVYKGEVTGYVRKPSDRLMELFLKARAPDKYRERVDHTVTAVPLTAEQLRAAREAGLRPEVEQAAATIAAIPLLTDGEQPAA